MTFRRRITWMVVSILLLSIILTGTISSAIINRYFQGYLSDEYEESVDIILKDAENLLTGETNQEQFHQYLRDPIKSISIYNNDEILCFFEGEQNVEHKKANMNRSFEGQVDKYIIESEGIEIGVLYVERSADIQDTETVLLFNAALLRAVGFAGLAALFLSFLLSKRLSKGITKDLKDTAEYANAIESAEEIIPKASKTIEIKNIQDRLENLSMKLKVQDNIRKEKVDHIAHETRTPITVLKSQMEGALDGVLEMNEKRLKTCLEATNKLQNLTQEITSVLEVEEEEIIPETEFFDLMDEVKMIQTGLLLQYKEKGLTFEVQGPSHLKITSDKNLLSVSLYNLLINSLKFTKQGGVQVIVSENPTKIVIKDTGIGISKEQIGKIFDPYFRAVTKEDYPGDGLGLYITKKNIEAMGGSLAVKSEVGLGTTFTIIL